MSDFRYSDAEWAAIVAAAPCESDAETLSVMRADLEECARLARIWRKDPFRLFALAVQRRAENVVDKIDALRGALEAADEARSPLMRTLRRHRRRWQAIAEELRDHDRREASVDVWRRALLGVALKWWLRLGGPPKAGGDDTSRLGRFLTAVAMPALGESRTGRPSAVRGWARRALAKMRTEGVDSAGA